MDLPISALRIQGFGEYSLHRVGGNCILFLPACLGVIEIPYHHELPRVTDFSSDTGRKEEMFYYLERWEIA